MATNKPKSTIGTRVIHGLVVASACVAVAVGIVEGDNPMQVSLINLGGVLAALLAIIGIVVAALGRWGAVLRFFKVTLFCAFAVAVIPETVSNLRTQRTTAELERLYAVLTQKGAPFPDSVDADLKKSDWWLTDHGYWVSDDRSAFELIQYRGSNSYFLEYPSVSGGGWKGQGAGYRQQGRWGGKNGTPPNSARELKVTDLDVRIDDGK